MYPNLCVEMARLNITQKEMCEKIGINVSTLSDKINGKKDFKLKECKKARDNIFSNCTIDYLFAKNVISLFINLQYGLFFFFFKFIQ